MTKKNEFIQYGKHFIDTEDIKEVTKVLKSNFLTSGPYSKKFEKAFSEYVGSKYAIVCSSGTAALHLASLAIGLKKGSSVIVPSISFLATANAPHYVGADIIFSDVDPITGLMTEHSLEEAILKTKKKIKAIFPVHLNGHSVDMISISKIANKFGIPIIEDACHALGTSIYGKKKVGACEFSDLSTFSFHPVKTIAMGEGGIITTNNKKMYDLISLLRNHGMEKEEKFLQQNDEAFDNKNNIKPWFYQMRLLGYNYRASELNCALGFSQIKKINFFYKRRKFIENKYKESFKNFSPHIKAIDAPKYSNSCLHLFALHIDFNFFKITKSELINKLKKKGIGSQVHYIPIYKQPYWKEKYGKQELPGAEKYYQSCLSIPFYPAMSDEQVEYVIFNLKELFSGI